MAVGSKLDGYEEEIVSKYISGISTNKLGIEYNCNPGTIYFLLQKRGVKVKKKQKFIGNIEDYKDDILNRFDSGWSAISISKELKISKPTILKVLHNNGRKLVCDVNYDNLLKDKKEVVINLYKSGKSTCEIAKIVNHAQSEIWKLLNKADVDTSDWKYNVDETFFEKIDTEEKAYILGWMYSDGNVMPDGKLRISIQISDRVIIDKITKILNYDGPIREKIKKGNRKTQIELCVNRKKMVYDLMKLGCIPNKSMVLKMPTFDQVPENLFNHFIRGVFDGDGSISTDGIANITTTDIFNDKLSDYLTKLLGITTRKYYRKKGRNTCSLHFNKQKSTIGFLTWLYGDATIWLDRKYEKWQKILAKLTLYCGHSHPNLV